MEYWRGDFRPSRGDWDSRFGTGKSGPKRQALYLQNLEELGSVNGDYIKSFVLGRRRDSNLAHKADFIESFCQEVNFDKFKRGEIQGKRCAWLHDAYENEGQPPVSDHPEGFVDGATLLSALTEKVSTVSWHVSEFGVSGLTGGSHLKDSPITTGGDE